MCIRDRTQGALDRTISPFLGEYLYVISLDYIYSYKYLDIHTSQFDAKSYSLRLQTAKQVSAVWNTPTLKKRPQ